MAAIIQPPDPERFKWERHTALVRDTGSWPSRDFSGCRGGKGLGASGCALPREDRAGRGKVLRDDSGVQQSFWRVVAAAAAEDVVAPSSPVSSAASLLQQVPVCSLGNSSTLKFS